jgi:RNA polymerase sigma factor (sigma-70 family)
MEDQWLAEKFEAHRGHLTGVAYRMLGSASEADDAVQEAWFKLSRADTSSIDNLGGWLTTVVARVCLDMLRSRSAKREEPLSAVEVDAEGREADMRDPEREAILADSLGLALLVVLETLTPTERIAFVLHDMFAVPFDDIATIIDRTPDATRQLASRARRRLQGVSSVPEGQFMRQRTVVEGFLAAARTGDFEALLAVLDPDVALRADEAAVRMGATAETGAMAVAKTFAGRAQAAQPALIDGAAGLVWAQSGEPRVVFAFTVHEGKVVGIEMVADRSRIDQLDIAILDG